MKKNSGILLLDKLMNELLSTNGIEVKRANADVDSFHIYGNFKNTTIFVLSGQINENAYESSVGANYHLTNSFESLMDSFYESLKGCV